MIICAESDDYTSESELVTRAKKSGIDNQCSKRLCISMGTPPGAFPPGRKRRQASAAAAPDVCAQEPTMQVQECMDEFYKPVMNNKTDTKDLTGAMCRYT